MKRLKFIIAAVIILGGIIAILINNKSKLEARAKDMVIDSYPVTTYTVEKREVLKSLELIGTITGNNDVAVASEAQGKVTAVYADIGDYKNKGDLLVQLDDELKKAAFKTAEVNFEKAKKDYERYKNLYEENSVSVSRLEAARLELQAAESQYIIARKEYDNTKITAPISGTVTAKLVDEGDYVNVGKIVSNIVDISKLKVKLNVAEKDAFKLMPGDKVEISTDIYPGAVFNGKIESISAKGDAAHTYPVEISFSNSKEYPLKSGMFGRVKFVSIQPSFSPVIPRESLIGSIKEPRVFVIENGVARERLITVGTVYDNMLEVKEGLNEGENVVVNGQNNLKDDFRVTVVN